MMNNSNGPLVSVLITTYNRSKVLKRAMASVLMQSLGNLELLVIDDCSTDDTFEIVQSFNDSRIRYFRNEVNIGASKGDRAHVRRFVYELMRGEYFVYLCDDDYWLSQTLLERQIQAFRTYPNLAMVVGGQLSYFIPTGCDFCLQSVEQIKALVFNLNGCYSWCENQFSYVAPNGGVVDNIAVDAVALRSLIEEKNRTGAFIIENQTPKFHLSNEELHRIVSKECPPITHHIALPPITDIPQISYKNLHAVPLPRTMFLKELYDKSYMTSLEFLTAFTADLVTRNIVAGATLYSKKHFIAAGAMSSENGSKWQAGYEFSLGPPCTGNVVYFDEPAVVVEVRSSNASFSGTQIDHYFDCLASIKYAFAAPLKKDMPRSQKNELQLIKNKAIRNVTRSFLNNTLAIKRYGQLTACSDKNIDRVVQPRHALYGFWLNGIMPNERDMKCFLLLQLPAWVIRRVVHGAVFF